MRKKPLLSKVNVHQSQVTSSPNFGNVSVRPLKSVSDHNTKCPTLDTDTYAAKSVPDDFGHGHSIHSSNKESVKILDMMGLQAIASTSAIHSPGSVCTPASGYIGTVGILGKATQSQSH